MIPVAKYDSMQPAAMHHGIMLYSCCIAVATIAV